MLFRSLTEKPTMKDGVLYLPVIEIAQIFQWKTSKIPSDFELSFTNSEADEMVIFTDKTFFLFNKEEFSWENLHHLYPPYVLNKTLMVPVMIFLKQLGAIDIQFDSSLERLKFYTLKHTAPQTQSTFVINNTYPCYQGSIYRNGTVIDECYPR